MTSRRDQVQAQSYVLGRLNSALVTGDPEAYEGPHRRILVGLIAGLLVGALVVAGFTVYGFLRPGGATAWKAPRTLIVEKETGTRYIYVTGTLRPVRNYASAVLLLGPQPKVVSVSAASLRSTPRGMPVGIVGAPDSLPGRDALVDTVWTVCAVPQRQADGTVVPATTLAITRSSEGRRLADDRGLLTRNTSGLTFLVWAGRRFALTKAWLAPALGREEPAMVVDPAWLNQLPAGPDIVPASMPGRGEPGPTVDGRATRIGQVFVARGVGTAERYFLLWRDGLSSLTATELAVVLADPATARAYGSGRVAPVELTPAALTRLPRSRSQALPEGLPGRPPAPPELSAEPWCVQHAVGSAETWVATQPLPSGMRLTANAAGVTRTGRTAVAVAVAPGVGGLVRVGRPGRAGGAGFFLVIDAGLSHPFADGEGAEAMGYALEDAVVVPPALLALLPTGPALDPSEARR